MLFDLERYLAENKERLDSELRAWLPAPVKDDPLKLREAIATAVLGGGDRLRASLVLATCEAVGGNPEQALPAACAVELVHTHSLIHHDLPALDNDLSRRRGQASCHALYGEATAILAGDALLTLAFEVLGQRGRAESERGSQLLRAVHELASASGCRGMVGGQALGVALSRQQASFEQLELYHSGKAAALFSASTAIGGIVGGGSQAQIDLLRTCGFDLGLAFQHADELLAAEPILHRERAGQRALELCRRAARAAERFETAGAALAAFSSWVEARIKKATADSAPS